MEITAVIQYILTAAQSFGSQYYHTKCLMTILGLACVFYSAKMNRHRQNGSSFVLKKILTGVLKEAVGGLKTTATQKQSDYKIEQSSFTLIALF